MNYLIKDLNKDEKPREKLLKIGVENLTDVELLSLIIRSGGTNTSAIDLSRELLKKYGGIKQLSQIDAKELTKIRHIDIAKASSLVAGLELGLRVGLSAPEKKDIYIRSPEDIYQFLKKDLNGKSKEYLYLISLNTRNIVIAKDLLSIGTINETLMSPREIFRQALTRNAVTIALVHNHPSGNFNPSNEDILSTNKVSNAAIEFGIIFLDHIIVTDKGFSSMKRLGQLDIFSNSKSKGGEINVS